jgi:hypothetical protein
MMASPNATLANMVSSFWLASRLMTERFSQYALRWQKSMTEPFGHNDVMGFRCPITAAGERRPGHGSSEVPFTPRRLAANQLAHCTRELFAGWLAELTQSSNLQGGHVKRYQPRTVRIGDMW